MTAAQLARALRDAPITAWRATLQMASPAERLELAQAAWLDLAAYGYNRKTGERA